MTATPRELAPAAELRSALAELNNVAIDARRVVKTEAERYANPNEPGGTFAAVNVLERLDAAIADAGEALSAVGS